VVQDDAVVVVDDLGFVAELGGVPEPAAADRPGVGVMQADQAGCGVGHHAGQPGPGLGDHGRGALHRGGQLADGAAQLPGTPAGALGQGAAGVTQHRGRVSDGVRSQVSQLAGDPAHGRLVLVAGLTQPQPGVDLPGSAAGGSGAVTPRGGRSSACGLDPADLPVHGADGLCQQAGVGRALHVGQYHGGIGADPSDPQQPGLGRFGQQRLVELVDHLATASGGDLHQGFAWRMAG
jgi:hypothetical protein